MTVPAESHNRKARRRALMTSKTNLSSSPSPSSAPAIPLAHPDRSIPKPKAKTLYEIAAERQALHTRSPESPRNSNPTSPPPKTAHTQPPTPPSHAAAGASTDETEALIGALGHSIFLSTTLSMLHFTLDVLVHHQYRQDIEWREIVIRTFTMLPVIFLLIYMLSSGPVARIQPFRQALFLGIAVAAGCYMTHLGSQGGYFAVMKRAPPVGTLWVWSVVELKLIWAVLSVVLVGSFYWWGGYTIF